MSYLIQQGVEIRVARAELLADGRKRLTRFLAFPQNSEFPLELAYAYGDLDPFNGTFPSGWDVLRLVKVEADNSPANNGAGNDPVVQVTYESPGTVTQRDNTGNNGALLTRTIISFYDTPATPSGYTLVNTSTENVNGYPYKAYTFAKGTGEVARAIDYGQSSDQGTTGVTRTTIRYLVVPGATVQPTSLAGSVEIARNMEEGDGYRIWTTVWAKGTGLVAQNISSRQDGLREVTNIALGTRSAPSGVVIRDDYAERDGFAVYTVTAMQTAAGGSDPTVATVVFERYVPFTYPGRAKAFEEVYNSRYMMDVFESPPITTLVKATVTVSYTTTNTLGTISDFWNPSEWATIRAQWIGLGNEPQNLVRARPGYRSTSATAITRTSSSTAPNNVSIFGNIVYGNTTAKITCTGGPADPGGSTYTLSAELEPAFTDAAGTKYYRKTLVSAAIPAQAALPV